MSFTTIDTELLQTVSGGGAWRDQVIDHLAANKDKDGIPVDLDMKCKSEKVGTGVCKGTYALLGGSNGIGNRSFQAEFDGGKLQQMKSQYTGGDY